MAKKKQPVLGPLHYHEALARAHSVGRILDDILLQHPVIQQYPALKEQVDRAAETLAQVYLDITNISDELFDWTKLETTVDKKS